MRVILTTILTAVDLGPDSDDPETPRVHGITIWPARGGRVVVLARKARSPVSDATVAGGNGSRAVSEPSG